MQPSLLSVRCSQDVSLPSNIHFGGVWMAARGGFTPWHISSETEVGALPNYFLVQLTLSHWLVCHECRVYILEVFEESH